MLVTMMGLFLGGGLLLTAVALIWDNWPRIVTVGWIALGALVLFSLISGIARQDAQRELYEALTGGLWLNPKDSLAVFLVGLPFLFAAAGVVHYLWWSEHPVRMAQIYLFMAGGSLMAIALMLNQIFIDRFRASG